MTFQSIHWTILLGCPTDVPTLCETFANWTTEQMCYAVRHDLKVCKSVHPDSPNHQEAQYIIEHLILFANEELERRGLEREF